MPEKYQSILQGGGSFNNLDIQYRRKGGVDVYYGSAEHKDSPETYPLEQIRQFVQALGDRAKFVLEYFVPELEETVFNGHWHGNTARGVAEKSGIISFSNRMEEIALEENINVLLMDPANSLMYDFHETWIPRVAVPAGGVVALSSLIMNRRQALMGLGLGGVSVAFGVQAIKSEKFVQDGRTVNMRDFRREQIDRGLDQYGETHEGESLFVLYPKTHVKALLYYADNSMHPLKRAAYDLIPGVTREIREYQPDQQNQSWNKVGSTPIR